MFKRNAAYYLYSHGNIGAMTAKRLGIFIGCLPTLTSQSTGKKSKNI